jgi:CheY-like chemotaxis protein
MRLLIIDDTSKVHQEFSEKLDGENIEIVSVYSRSEALSRLGEDYDLIICDLKMPSDPTGGEPEVVHGLSVCDAARSTRPGIPVVILSAFGDINDLDDRLSDSPQEPFLGGNDVAMLRHKLKSKIDDAIELVREHSRRLQDLNREIEFNWTANEIDLSVYEWQALLLYAAQRNGVFVRLRGLAGGRSGAKVVWIEIERDNGAVVGRGVAKIDTRDRVLAEYEKFRVYVADLLPAGSFATTINVIKAGASDSGLIVYSLANEVSLFHALTDADHSIARDVVERLFESTEPWHGSRTVARKTVGEIRQLMANTESSSTSASRTFPFRSMSA